MAISAETEKRVLYGAVGAAGLGALVMLICMGTSYWVILEIPRGSFRNATQAYVKSHHSGLWRICRVEVDNRTIPHIKRDSCTFVKLFPSEEEIKSDPEVDTEILNYSRSETAFAVISLLLMVLGISFSVYSLYEPRYMFKRLSALLHFMTAGCVFVSVEVLMSSVNYERENLPARHPEGSYIHYGFSFGLCWVIIMIYICCGIVFLFLSKKRKGNKALSEKEAQENEPINIGRI